MKRMLYLCPDNVVKSRDLFTLGSGYSRGQIPLAKAQLPNTKEAPTQVNKPLKKNN